MTFKMWSVGHYLFMILPIVIIIVLHVLTRKKSQHFKQNLGIMLSVVAVVVLLLRNFEIFRNQGYAFDYEIIPLQICHFANFVLLYAFMTDNKAFFGLATLFNLPTALLSIVYANSLENYTTILTLRGGAYIIGHALIVIITVWAYLNGFVKLNKKVLKQTIFAVLIMYAVGLVLNNVMLLTTGEASNYFYATRPEHGTPLAWFFNWGVEYHIGGFFIVNPLYLILTGMLGITVISLLYVLLKWLQPNDKEKVTVPDKMNAGYRSFVKD